MFLFSKKETDPKKSLLYQIFLWLVFAKFSQSKGD